MTIWNVHSTPFHPIPPQPISYPSAISHSAQAPGLTELKWSHGAEQIPEFIAGAMKVVSDVSAIVDIMKAPPWISDSWIGKVGEELKFWLDAGGDS